jgi:hypothetical protein
MASQLASIVDAIAALSITDFAIPVLRGSTMKNQIDDPDIPTRIISAVGMSSARTKTTTLGGSGHVMMTQWTITDVALLRSAGIGMGLRDVSVSMQSYLAAYHDAVRTLAAPSWQVVDVQCRAQILEWPTESGRRYDTVFATLLISEIVQ